VLSFFFFACDVEWEHGANFGYESREGRGGGLAEGEGRDGMNDSYFYYYGTN